MNFKTDYDKLHVNIFPTIRSIHYMDKWGIYIGCTKPVHIAKKFAFKAKLVSFQDLPINDIPLSLLQYDTNPFDIINHNDFLNLINSFIPSHYMPTALTTMKRIMWWEKVVDSERRLC